jgi:hypothetical protein
VDYRQHQLCDCDVAPDPNGDCIDAIIVGSLASVDLVRDGQRSYVDARTPVNFKPYLRLRYDVLVEAPVQAQNRRFRLIELETPQRSPVFPGLVLYLGMEINPATAAPAGGFLPAVEVAPAQQADKVRTLRHTPAAGIQREYFVTLK